MPSDTFFNLNKEKRQSLIEAAKEEFTKKKYEDASINQIIKNSNISRGSFYMYFLNKEDLYFYLLDTYMYQLDNVLCESLVRYNGDIFKTFSYLFDFTIEKCTKGNESKFFEKIILNMNYLMENKILIKRKNPKNMDKILSYVNLDLLTLDHENDLVDLYNMIFIIMMHSVIAVMHNINGMEKLKRRFHNQLILIKRQIYKEVNDETDI